MSAHPFPPPSGDFTDGYRLGFAAGRDVGRDIGYAQAEHDMAQAWAALAARVRRLATSPSQAALEHLRWDGRRTDFGNPRPGDHPGGPKHWHGTATERGAA